MYWLKKEIVVDFGELKKEDVADRIGITLSHLSRILNRRVGCTKPTANYIARILEFSTKGKYNDKKIQKYFEKKEKK